MIKNKLFIFIILVLAMFSINAAGAEDSSSVNVTDVSGEVNTILEVDNSVEDVDSQLQSGVKNFDDLKSAIDASSDNSVLDLDCDYKYDGTGNFSGITISNNNFTIDGHGHTIDANPGSNYVRIFNITGNNIALKNLILINANIKDYGAAIYNNGNLVYISNTTFINNSAGSGAIYNEGVNFTVCNSSFVNNSAASAGVIWNYGANFRICNSSFVNNSAGISAGVIYNDVRGTNFTICNSNFVNNKASGYAGGGVILNDGANFRICNSIFVNNTAGGYTGGVIRNNDGANFTVCNSIFVNNSAGGGGVIYNYLCCDNFTVYNCSFVNNSAGGGGAIVNYGGDNFMICNSSFVNNSAEYYGCAIYNCGGDNFMICNSSFVNNAEGSYFGGAIYNNGGINFTLCNSIFVNNSAGGDGGGVIHNNGGANLTICNCIFVNNTATSNGGVIVNYGANFTLCNCIFVNNTAASNGGAIYNGGVNFTVCNSTFTNNNAKAGTAIYNKNTINLTNNTYSGIAEGKTYIFNSGTILTPVTVTVLGNKTIKTEAGKEVVLFAVITTSDGASVSGGTLNFIVNGTAQTANATGNDNGTYNLTYVTSSVYGKYLVNATYANATNVSVETGILDVSKLDTKVNITIIVYGEDVTFKVNLTNGATGNVTVTIDGKEYAIVNLTDGGATVSVSNLTAGEHEINVIYSGDDKYAPASANKTVTVANNLNLTADDVVMIYKDGSRFYATLLDAKGNPIANATLSFTINGVSYDKTTDASGVASIALNLNYGVYNARVSYDENNTVNATVTINSSIAGDDIVKIWRNDTQFYGTFLGADGKALANTNVTFNINGVLYTRSTDANGTARLAINLNPGKYVLTAVNPVNGEQKGFNVSVKSLIEACDLNKYYLNASGFVAKIYNKDGSLAINKDVEFNINGVFYKRTTDANGSVGLAINLRPGEYDITTIYDGLASGNKVNVLSTLETEDLSMSFRDGSAFKVKTLDGEGKILANQNVTLNVNGVLYHRTSGSDGVASLNINLNKGEYIITSMWNNYQVGNKITIV